MNLERIRTREPTGIDMLSTVETRKKGVGCGRRNVLIWRKEHLRAALKSRGKK